MLTRLRSRATPAHEGPAYDPATEVVYFATPRRERGPGAPGPLVSIRRWRLRDDAVDTFVEDARVANGLVLAGDGEHLVVCEQGDRERPGGVVRYRLRDARREAIAARYRGQPFNSPNKVVELPSGGLVFTDPDYGVRQGFRAASPLGTGVYLRRPGGEVVRLETALIQPHGLALAPGGDYLLVSDTAADDGTGGYRAECPHHVWRYRLDVRAGRLSDARRLLASPSGIPDGMACDTSGCLYCATGDGVRAYGVEDGRERGFCAIEGGAVGLTWAPTAKRLWVTTGEALLELQL